MRMSMRTSNPVLSERAFRHFSATADESDTMTVRGTINRTMIVLMLLVAGSILTWTNVMEAVATGQRAMIMPWLIGGLIAGLVCALVIWFKPTAAPFAAPAYGFFEGLFLGAVSAIFELSFPGIVMMAVTLTFGTLFTMLIIYRSGIVQVNDKFRGCVMCATGAICLVYLASFVMGMFGGSMPMIHSSGPMGIGFSLVVIVVAALNLMLDFDFISRAAKGGAPRYMEWVGAFGLMVTLVWLYLEFLRLLSKFQRR